MHFSTTGKILLGLMGVAFFQGLTSAYEKESEVEDEPDPEPAPPPPRRLPTAEEMQRQRVHEIYREYYLRAKYR